MKKFLVIAAIVAFALCIFIVAYAEDSAQTPVPPPPPVTDLTGEKVKIPDGTFMMGCSPGDLECWDNEKPPRKVSVGSFWMDTTEVTKSAYEQVMGTNPSFFPRCPNCPVESVTWDDANNYCRKVGKRLPTEAEWEYAARGGTTGARYGDLDSIAWYDKNSNMKTHPVALKQPNAYGLYDMLGNVGEWTSSWYDAKRTDHVRRGGNWNFVASGVRSSNRDGPGPAGLGSHGGFRCVRD